MKLGVFASARSTQCQRGDSEVAVVSEPGGGDFFFFNLTSQTFTLAETRRGAPTAGAEMRFETEETGVGDSNLYRKKSLLYGHRN